MIAYLLRSHRRFDLTASLVILVAVRLEHQEFLPLVEGFVQYVH